MHKNPKQLSALHICSVLGSQQRPIAQQSISQKHQTCGRLRIINLNTIYNIKKKRHLR